MGGQLGADDSTQGPAQGGGASFPELGSLGPGPTQTPLHSDLREVLLLPAPRPPPPHTPPGAPTCRTGVTGGGGGAAVG